MDGVEYLGVAEGAFTFRALQQMSARGLLLAIGLSRPVVARIFSSGQLLAGTDLACVEDDGGARRVLHPSDRIEAGEVVGLVPRVALPAQGTPRRVVAQAGRGEERACANPSSSGDGLVSLRILYEDEFLIAVDKPQGLLVHGDGTGAETLTDRVAACLLARDRAAEREPAATASPIAVPPAAGMPPDVSVVEPQALQRLDVDTSGIVLFSKVEEFQPLFDAIIAGDGMTKSYLAVVDGAFSRDRMTVRDPIGRDRHDARRMRVSPTGQAALTEVERIAVAPDGRHTLLLVRLGTGRRHQIRVHLASKGFPITNDPLYGVVGTSDGLMLHAVRERFVHPLTGAEAVIESDVPDRFRRMFDFPGGSL